MSSSWADATEEEPIPAPLPPTKATPAPGHEARPALPVPVPDRPPWCAYVGNLPFTATEADVRALFGTLSIEPTGVRLPTERGSDKHKGFAYCTFSDAATLVAAIAANGKEVQGRPARVSIADPNSNPGRNPRPERAAGGKAGGSAFFSAGGKPAAAGPADVAGTWRSNNAAVPPPVAPVAGRGAGRGGRGAGRGSHADPATQKGPASPSGGAPLAAAHGGTTMAGRGGGRGRGAGLEPAPTAAAAAQPSRAPGAEKEAKPAKTATAQHKALPAQPAAAVAKPKNAFAMLAASDDDDDSD